MLSDLDFKDRKCGKVELHGCKYDFIHSQFGTDANSRVNWIKSTNYYNFSPQPYEQLSGVLKNMGHYDAAIAVNIAKEDERLRFHNNKKIHGFMNNFYNCFYLFCQFFYKLLTCYGYRPFHRTFSILFTLLIIGWGLYTWSYDNNLISPTHKPSDIKSYENHSWVTEQLYPSFHPFIYSADTLIPIVQFGQSDYWHPTPYIDADMNIGLGKYILIFMYLQIIIGWILTTFIIYGIAGLIRKNDN